MNHPRTSALLEHIRQRDGQVGLGLRNAPEEWVKLARELEAELAAMKVRIEATETEYHIARGTVDALIQRTAKAEVERDAARAALTK